MQARQRAKNDGKRASDPTRLSEFAYTSPQRSAEDVRPPKSKDEHTRGRLSEPWDDETSAPIQSTDEHLVLERQVMFVKNAAEDVMAAVAVMKHARDACANLSPMGLPMSPAQIEHRARVIAAVINASRKLQQLRDRAVSLESALARFRARKAELAA
jgi:hypothetical protein